jgi:peptide deformylase
MAIRRIRQLGDPVLRARCQRVERPASAAVRLIADDLRDTLKAAKKKYGMGRALAAPQIGAPVRVVVVDIEGAKQRITLINPEVTDVGSEDFEVWDDCFSFPDLLVRVNRAYRISVSYLDLRGKPHVLECEGALAELLQHEIDHLDGILTLDRAVGTDPFAYRDEWAKHHDPLERSGPPRLREAPDAAFANSP